MPAIFGCASAEDGGRQESDLDAEIEGTGDQPPPGRDAPNRDRQRAVQIPAAGSKAPR